MTETTASTNPLCIPEILRNVFSHCTDDPSAVAEAMLVNSQWFDLLSSVLWDEVPTEALMGIKEHRRHIYASKLAKISLLRPGQYYTPESLHFPRKPLSEADVARRELIRTYISSSTQSVKILDLGTEALLDEIRTCCVNLKQFCINNRGFPVTERALHQLLSERVSLQDVRLASLRREDETDKILLCLANMPNLSHLFLRRELTSAVLQRVLDTVATPFAKLQTFAGQIVPSAIPLLPDCVKNITKLHLHLYRTSDDTFRHISQLKELSFLEVYFEKGGLQRTDILALIPLQNLVNLYIGFRWRYEGYDNIVGEDDFSTKDFAAFLSGIGRSLRKIRLDFNCQVRNALELLAEFCPRLEYFDMAGLTCELLEPRERSERMFPCLEELSVLSFIKGEVDRTLDRFLEDDYDDSELFWYLRDFAPNLETFTIGSPGSYTHGRDCPGFFYEDCLDDPSYSEPSHKDEDWSP